jgi:hypothetical protein
MANEWSRKKVKEVVASLKSIEAEQIKQTALLQEIASSLKPSPVRLVLKPSAPEPQ